jgi:hypothetical protein
VLELHVHLRQGLLHMLNMLARHLHQVVAMPHQRAHGTHLALRTKRRMQQTHGMPLLDPLTLVKVGSFTRHVLHIPRIHQTRLYAVPLHRLIHRNPVHSGGFHRHCRHSTAHQPFGHLVQIAGERPASTDRMVIAIRRHGYVDLSGSDIDAGRIRLK